MIIESYFRVDLDSEEGPGDSACVVSSVLSDTTATMTSHHDISLTGMTLSGEHILFTFRFITLILEIVEETGDINLS